jgi:hypothetical protein
MTTKTAFTNRGIDVEPLLAFKEMAQEYPVKADRNPIAVAEWVGGDQ